MKTIFPILSCLLLFSCTAAKTRLPPLIVVDGNVEIISSSKYKLISSEQKAGLRMNVDKLIVKDKANIGSVNWMFNENGIKVKLSCKEIVLKEDLTICIKDGIEYVEILIEYETINTNGHKMKLKSSSPTNIVRLIKR